MKATKAALRISNYAKQILDSKHQSISWSTITQCDIKLITEAICVSGCWSWRWCRCVCWDGQSRCGWRSHFDRAWNISSWLVTRPNLIQHSTNRTTNHQSKSCNLQPKSPWNFGFQRRTSPTTRTRIPVEIVNAIHSPNGHTADCHTNSNHERDQASNSLETKLEIKDDWQDWIKKKRQNQSLTCDDPFTSWSGASGHIIFVDEIKQRCNNFVIDWDSSTYG